MIELYSKPNCPACVVTKNRLKTAKVAFMEYTIGVDVERDAVLERFPDARMLPIVVVDGVWVMDIENLLKQDE